MKLWDIYWINSTLSKNHSTLAIYIIPSQCISKLLPRVIKVIWPQSPICKIGTSTFLVMSVYVMPFINKFVLVRRGEFWRNICKVYLRDKSCYKVNDVATYVITRHSRVVAYITVKQYYQQTQERKGIFASYICLKILHYYYIERNISQK